MTSNMGPPHGIDNYEQVFEFDPYEGPSSAPSSTDRIPGPSWRDDPTNGGTMLYGLSEAEPYVCKGKGSSSIPMPTRSPSIAHDVFDATIDVSTNAPCGIPSTSLTPPLVSHCHISTDHLQLAFDSMDVDADEAYPENGEGDNGKGKGKEMGPPPTLPPLHFSPAELGYDASDWPSTSFSAVSPGPSSYGSGYGSLTTTPAAMTGQLSGSAQPPITPSVSEPPLLTRIPSRRRSLSNLSTHSSRSLAAQSGTKLRFGTAKPTSSLARKLLFKKREEGLASLTRSAHIINTEGVHAGQGNCLLPWCGDFRSSSDSHIISPLKELEIAINTGQQTLPMYHQNHATFKTKGRSNSSPLPISALDLVFLPSSNDVFIPLPFVVRNFFDEVLPRELKLYIFRTLVCLHEDEHAQANEDGTWSVMKASSSKGRWVGRNRGARELVKLSRVSRSWYKLTFDGQLWSDLDLRAFSSMPSPVIQRLAETGGRFIKSVDLAGHDQLTSSTLVSISDSLCLEFLPSEPIPYTQLTCINLQGCSSLTTRSLHHILIRSPSLQTLLVKGLPAVTNSTCELLAVYCRQLSVLNASRCTNLDSQGVKALANAYLTRGDHSRLKTLRLSALKYVDDDMMRALGKAAPYLEVLDLSYARQLHNSAIDAFVACGYDERAEELGVKTIVLPAREVGRESSDDTKCRRRVTRLRHLSLSSCILLTDTACANLAHSVPNLEFLELAGIGGSLKDGGLISLLNSTPFIRRLDVEDAAELSDAFLASITPVPQASHTSLGASVPQSGHQLEHLIISSAGELSDGGLLSLVRNCAHLRVLEADNTHISSSVLKEFVRLSRQRQIVNAKIAATDCRFIGESSVRSLTDLTRPRLGWRAHEARRLRFLDARDTRDGVEEELKIGQDECDEKRVIVKTFYSWQTVDAVRAEREKRRKRQARRAANESGGSWNTDDEENGSGNGGSTGLRSVRWWTPNGARRFSSSGLNSSQIPHDMSNEGCTIM